MSVLTPFPNRSADNQNYANANSAALRNEINRVMSNAFETIQGYAPGHTPGAATRNPILALQSEINRIISLLLQSGMGSASVSVNPAAPAPFATGYGYGQTVAPVPYTGTVVGSNQSQFGALLLSEINRVFNTVLQDGSLYGQSGWPSENRFPSISGGYGNFAVNPVSYLQNEINRIFNSYVPDQNGFSGDGTPSFTPKVNFAETSDSIEIEAELPGFTENDIDLAVTGNVVTIKGWRRRSTNENVQDFHILERGYGTFSRSLTLPFEADPSLVRASFSNGLLSVEITKPESVRENTQRIEIAKAG